MNSSLRAAIAVISLCLCAIPCAGKESAVGGLLRPKIDTSTSQPAPLRLQGAAEYRQILNPQLAAWQATQFYRTGAAAMAYGDYMTAAQYFKLSGDIFETALGPGKLAAESRFAEAQMCHLMRMEPRAVALFRIAADMFQRYDPYNPYLKAAMDMSQPEKPKPLEAKITVTHLKGAVEKHEAPKLVALPAMADSVDRNITLKGGVAQFADGTKFGALKDDQVFRVGKALADAVPAEISDNYIKAAIKKAFLKMTCLEFAALGGNYYTAPDLYKAFKAKGKTVVIGAADDFWSPVLKLKLNGNEYGVCMDLPGLSSGSKVILPVTDGEHVLAIDPRTGDSWKLQATPGRKTPDFNWWKLTHTKKT
jgi:hypothetical protein